MYSIEMAKGGGGGGKGEWVPVGKYKKILDNYITTTMS